MATHDGLVADYDLVLVHGDPDLVPLDASWPVEDRIRPLLRDTGYVDEGEPVAPCAERRGIVVSGGSSAAALPLLDAALAAAKTVTREPWRALVGAGVPEAEFARLGAAAPGHVAVERARPDFRLLLAGAAVSVSQAGYNTVVDLFRAGPRPVLVPFEAGSETEQRLRAERLEAAGLATLLPERDLSPERLAAAVERALAAPQARAPSPASTARTAPRPSSSTPSPACASRRKARSALPPRAFTIHTSRLRLQAVKKGRFPPLAACGGGPPDSDLPEARSSMRKPENAPPEARPLARPRSLVPGPSLNRERGAALDWHPLREAFARRRDAGAEPALWWRDDDAGADSPALRRLIALARESGCPVAVAAIPRRTDQA